MGTLKHWYYLQIASIIEKAANDPRYMCPTNGRLYLCSMVSHWFPPLTWLTRRYIVKNLRVYTLDSHLDLTYGSRVKGMNKAFWVCVVKRIRVFKDYSGFSNITVSDIILEDARLNQTA